MGRKYKGFKSGLFMDMQISNFLLFDFVQQVDVYLIGPCISVRRNPKK